MGYPAAAALVAAAAGAAREALDALDTEQLEALRTQAIIAVETHCAQSFETAETLTLTLDGDGSKRLRLPRRLADLDELSVTGTTLAADQVVIADDRGSLTITPVDTSNAYLRAMASMDEDMAEHRRRFHAGEGNIAITGLWGWPDEDFPASVGVALRMDMEENALADGSSLAGTIHAFRRMGLRSVRQGNLAADIGPGQSGLSPRAQRMVADFVWLPTGIAV